MDIMMFEAVEDKLQPGQWRVEAFDEEGAPEIALFIGKNSKELATDYAAYLNRRAMKEINGKRTN